MFCNTRQLVRWRVQGNFHRRHLLHDPEKIVGPCVKPGMTFGQWEKNPAEWSDWVWFPCHPRSDRRNQFLWIDGLVDVIVAASIGALLTLFGHGVGGQGNDRLRISNSETVTRGRKGITLACEKYSG
jgi:hypothetical protein